MRQATPPLPRLPQNLLAKLDLKVEAVAVVLHVLLQLRILLVCHLHAFNGRYRMLGSGGLRLEQLQEV